MESVNKGFTLIGDNIEIKSYGLLFYIKNAAFHNKILNFA